MLADVLTLPPLGVLLLGGLLLGGLLVVVRRLLLLDSIHLDAVLDGLQDSHVETMECVPLRWP